MNKPRYDLIPPEALDSMASVLAHGVGKHGDRNWEKGWEWSNHFAALMRHLWKWWNPLIPSIDEETGRSHLDHAICRLAFLIAYESRGIGIDDRKYNETDQGKI